MPSSRVIVLVEDNELDVKLVKRALTRNASQPDVRVATDGQKGVHLLFEECESCPDLVLLDINLPKYDGFEILAMLRKNERTKHVPVVMFSSSDRREDIQRSYEAGANGYMRKVEDYDEYLANLQSLGSFWLGVNLCACAS
ncbi:MAG TPA: response regulator [Fimbriimonadaceae bacterium]|nr:response regulator [Fimbriimonadaceae bacterium]